MKSLSEIKTDNGSRGFHPYCTECGKGNDQSDTTTCSKCSHPAEVWYIRYWLEGDTAYNKIKFTSYEEGIAGARALDDNPRLENRTLLKRLK